MGYYYASYPTTIIGRAVNTIVSVITLALVIRLVLQLLSANPASIFVAWIYGITDPLVAPFVGMFPAANLGIFFLDFATIFALIAYVLLGWVVMYFFGLLMSMVNPYEYEPRLTDV